MYGIFVQPVMMNMMAFAEHGSLKSTPPLMESATETPKEVMKPLFALNEPITKHSARIIRRQMLAAGHVNKEDRRFLRELIMHGNLLDEESFHILLNLLLTGLQDN
jgi:hypothetical protein